MKRSHCMCEGDVLVGTCAPAWAFGPPPPQQQQQQQQQLPPAVDLSAAAVPGGAEPAKRACRAGVGSMGEPALLAFLQRELAGVPLGLVPDAAWAALAELNLILRGAASSTWRGSRARGMHFFARSSRLASWMAFAAALGLEEGRAAALARGERLADEAAPTWMRLACAVLGHALGDCPESSLTLYTVALPDPLLSWAARWGIETTGGCVRLLRVEAFDAGGGSAEPARSLFLPALFV